MKPLALFCLAFLVGCSSKVVPVQATRVPFSALGDVIDLINYQAAAITVTRAAGSQGKVPADLASALGVANASIAADQKAYAPVPVEMRIHDLLKQDEYYPKLATMLNPHNEATKRATASISLDYADFSEIDSPYQDKIHKEYFYEFGLSFRLLDAQQKVVFEKKLFHAAQKACSSQGGSPCLQDLNYQPLPPQQQIILGELRKALHQLLFETTQELHAWAETLRNLKAIVEVNHDSGKKLQLEEPEIWLRQKNRANQHYFFVDIPNSQLKLERLFADLENLGTRLDHTDKERLTNYVATTFRSRLDHYLRERMQGAGSFENAGIFLLPDSSAIWFLDALSIAQSNAINENGNEVRAFDRLCQNHADAANMNTCASIALGYGSSPPPDESHVGIMSSVQMSSVVSALLFDSQTRRYLPNPRQAQVDGKGYSPAFYNLSGNANRGRKKAIYLKAALKLALGNLADKMADNIVQSFQQSLAEQRGD